MGEPCEVFRLTFRRELSPGKRRAHLSPEGRIQTVCEVSQLLLGAGVQTVQEARAALAATSPDPELPRRLKRVFGFGPAMLQNLRMDVDVLTAKPDVHLKRFLAPFMGVGDSAPAQAFITALQELRDLTGIDPFVVDQIIWCAKAASGQLR